MRAGELNHINVTRPKIKGNNFSLFPNLSSTRQVVRSVKSTIPLRTKLKTAIDVNLDIDFSLIFMFIALFLRFALPSLPREV